MHSNAGSILISLVVLLSPSLASVAAGQACAFTEGEIYFNQAPEALGLPPSQIGLATIDPHSCSVTTIAPGTQIEGFPKYDPFRGALVGRYGNDTQLYFCDGSATAWNVTGTVQGSITALAPRGDGKVYVASHWAPTQQQVLGYIDAGDVFHPLLDPTGALVPIPFENSGVHRDLMYSAETNSLVHIIVTTDGAPCPFTSGLKITWIDLNADGTGLTAVPTIQTEFSPCDGETYIYGRMARTSSGTFVFVMKTAGAAYNEIVELDPATKTRSTFALMSSSNCFAVPPLSVAPCMGLAFDEASQQVIVPIRHGTCFSGVFNYELRGIPRSLTPTLGELLCALPSHSTDPNDGLPNSPWSISDLFDISSPGGVWTKLGFGLSGTSGVPNLIGVGTLGAGSPGSLALSNAKPLSPALLFMSLTSTPVPFKGGTLAANPWLLTRFVSTNGSGAIPLSWSAWPAGIPANTSLYFQHAILDAAGPAGVSLSNAIKGTTH